MDLPNGGDGLVYQNSNNNSNNIQKLLPPSPPPPPIFTPTPTHYHRSKRCIQLKSKALLIVSAFLLTVIILQIAIIGLIINYHYVQNANSGSSLTMRAKGFEFWLVLLRSLDISFGQILVYMAVGEIVPPDTGKAPSELEVRGQMLQLADLLSWDAKCNRVLHDLVVSCYGAPDYLASGGKDSTKTGRFQYNRNFPRNLETPPRHGQKYRKTRPLKPLYTDGKINQTQRESSKEMIDSDSQVTPNPTLIEI